MKRLLFAFGLILITLPLILVPVSAAKPGPAITVTLLNPPPDGLLVLPVGESYTFDILLTSDEPFNSAVAKVDIYYPGKGVFWHAGTDIVKQSTSAELHLTVIGKSSTADLAPVIDWQPYGLSWPGGGVAPQVILVGARFQGGLVSYASFPFAIQVP